jgi:diketogulonate reductase-like aldo/keto reductase
VPDLDEALAIAGEGRIARNQVFYHLLERAIEWAVLPWCDEHGLAVVAYSPFGHGQFPSPTSPGGRVLGAVAAAHEENARAGSLHLTPEELARIDEAFPRGPRPRELPTL